MTEPDKRKNVELLIDQFRRQGYMTISRKFGRYLPAPDKVGDFEIDIVARYKSDYAIGISVSEEDLKDRKFLERLTYLATRQTKFSNRPVVLFAGVPDELFKTVKALIENIDAAARKNIRLLRITETVPAVKNTRRQNRLFS